MSYRRENPLSANQARNTSDQMQLAVDHNSNDLPGTSVYGNQGRTPAFEPTMNYDYRPLPSTVPCSPWSEAAPPQTSRWRDERCSVPQPQRLNADASSYKPPEIAVLTGDQGYIGNYQRNSTRLRDSKQDDRGSVNEQTGKVQNAQPEGGNGSYGHGSGGYTQGLVTAAEQLNSGTSGNQAHNKRINSIQAENIPPYGGGSYYHPIYSNIGQCQGARENGGPSQAGATQQFATQPLVVHSSYPPRGASDRY